MSRPPLEVADLVRTAGEAFIERSRQWIRWKHVKVLRAIAACRTAVLGGHVDQCTRCGHRAISYNSCRNRHCPKCQAGARDRWLAKRRQELLPTRSVPVQKHFSKWLAIRDTLVQRSASSACCTHGVNDLAFTPMFIAWFRPAGCRSITLAG